MVKEKSSSKSKKEKTSGDKKVQQEKGVPFTFTYSYSIYCPFKWEQSDQFCQVGSRSECETCRYNPANALQWYVYNQEDNPAHYWQLCPRCSGQGLISMPPEVPGDAESFSSSDIVHTCHVCDGEKIISTYSGKPPSKHNNNEQED